MYIAPENNIKYLLMVERKINCGIFIQMKATHTYKKNIYNVCVCVYAAAAKSLQSCPTLCNPINGSPPGSPFPGILQARTLEWVAISFSNA